MMARDRRGFSLLEVLLASSILLGCVIVLGHLAYLGRRNARAALDSSTAQILCESKMGELLAGIAPLEQGGGFSHAYVFVLAWPIRHAVLVSHSPGWLNPCLFPVSLNGHRQCR